MSLKVAFPRMQAAGNALDKYEEFHGLSRCQSSGEGKYMVLFAIALLQSTFIGAPVAPALPHVGPAEAAMHELGHPRHAIPVDSAPRGFAQLRLQLIVSPTGDVVSATAHGSADESKYCQC